MIYRDELQIMEDQEQAAALSAPSIVLPFHPRTKRVLRGEWRGTDANVAAFHIQMDLLDRHQLAEVFELHLRPWWRLFRLTPAYRIQVER